MLLHNTYLCTIIVVVIDTSLDDHVLLLERDRVRSDLPLCRVFPPTHPAPQDYLWILVHIVGKEDEKWERVDHRRWRKTLVKYHASLPEAPSYDVYRDSSKKQKTGDGTGDGDGGNDGHRHGHDI